MVEDDDTASYWIYGVKVVLSVFVRANGKAKKVGKKVGTYGTAWQTQPQPRRPCGP